MADVIIALEAAKANRLLYEALDFGEVSNRDVDHRHLGLDQKSARAELIGQEDIVLPK